MFFFSTFWGFYPLIHAIFTFPPEREMLLKERASGMYRLSAFFWARILGDLPLELTLPTVFVGIVYKMGGLKSSFVSFLLTLLAVLYNVLVAQVHIVILHGFSHWISTSWTCALTPYIPSPSPLPLQLSPFAQKMSN